MPLGKHVAQKGGTRQFASTNKNLKPYVEEFEKIDQNQKGDSFKVEDIPVNFGDPDKDEFEGVCYIYGDGTREIIVRKSWWNQVSEHDRRSLIFHELGHCRLDRDHDNTIIELEGTDLKASLMHEVIVSAQKYKENTENYNHELFSQDKSVFLEEE